MRHVEELEDQLIGGTMDVESRVSELREEAERLKEADACRSLTLYSRAIFLQGENVGLFMARGKLYLELGDFHAAAVDFRHAVRMKPTFGWIRSELARVMDTLGMIYFEKAQTREALACLDECIQLQKQIPNFYMHRALVNLELGDINAVLDDTEKYCESVQDDADVYILRGKIFWSLGLSERAFVAIKRAKQLNPLHPEIAKFDTMLTSEALQEGASASQMMLLGEYSAAIKVINSALKANPEDTKLHLLGASAYRRLGDLDRAMKYVENALQCNQSQQQQRRLATPFTLKELEEVKHEKALILNQLAVDGIKHSNNKPEEKRQIFDKLNTAAELCQSIDAIYMHRGDLLRENGQLDCALDDYNNALELQPGNKSIKRRIALINYYKGQDRFNEGKFSEAEEHFTTSIEFHPTQAEYFSNRGLTRVRMQNLNDASADFEYALKLDETNVRARSWMALGNKNTGRKKGHPQPRKDKRREHKLTPLDHLKIKHNRLKALQKPIDISRRALQTDCLSTTKSSPSF
mmetsp:Transcript_29946/g.47578  ORF Transcript_29946/g.47578 Transcript_29946/m.47578 type:complete len:523 (+) Transcript_29946:24-1592(+)